MSHRDGYEILLVTDQGEVARPGEWLGVGSAPTRLRIVREGTVIGEVPATSGDGRFDAGAFGQFEVRYAWVDEHEAVSYVPRDFDRGFRECGGLPDTVALYRRADSGRYVFADEDELGWPPPFRRRQVDLDALSLATRVEYMDGEIDTLPLAPSPRHAGTRDVAR